MIPHSKALSITFYQIIRLLKSIMVPITTNQPTNNHGDSHAMAQASNIRE